MIAQLDGFCATSEEPPRFTNRRPGEALVVEESMRWQETDTLLRSASVARSNCVERATLALRSLKEF